MQVVIDIPEDKYNEIIKDDYIPDGNFRRNCIQAIRTGTPLPKHHGRLIDADELKKDYPHNSDWDYPVSTNSYVVESIDNTPTILEATEGNG